MEHPESAKQAQNLAGLGARCVIVDLQDEKGGSAKELGGLYVKTDVADEEQVRCNGRRYGNGPLRALVNGAGIEALLGQ